MRKIQKEWSEDGAQLYASYLNLVAIDTNQIERAFRLTAQVHSPCSLLTRD